LFRDIILLEKDKDILADIISIKSDQEEIEEINLLDKDNIKGDIVNNGDDIGQIIRILKIKHSDKQ